MVLQASGTITIQDIEGEFGGTSPTSLSEYYRGGPYTTSNNSNVPTSGAISFSDFYGAQNTIAMTYEIIGGGGEGGGGYTGDGPGAAGTSSFFSGTGFTPVSSGGGAGGTQPGPFDGTFTPGEAGKASAYGPGGAGGANSDTNNQTPGFSAPSTSYGAGGGGGGSFTFAAQNGGGGGRAAVRRTGSVNVTPGTTISVTIGSGGNSIGGGGNGAGGYARFTVGGQTFTYTSPGNYSFTVPS